MEYTTTSELTHTVTLDGLKDTIEQLYKCKPKRKGYVVLPSHFSEYNIFELDEEKLRKFVASQVKL